MLLGNVLRPVLGQFESVNAPTSSPAAPTWLFSESYPLGVVVTELLLIGVPVYLILRFLRGTRGARLIEAVGLILVLSFLVVHLVADRLHLDRVTFLYPYFVLSISLVALVVFQTELRRGLIRLGERGLLRSWSRRARPEIDPIVSAVTKLAKKKIGALIAIERSTTLGGLTESGVQLDATSSAELIESIFWPGTPLHDLGLVIQGDRILAAGCQFPLVESGEVDRALGSRHRAGLGLSGECDAIIIIVSEETGTISVAQHGRLRRSLKPDTLRQLLIDAFDTVSDADAGGARFAWLRRLGRARPDVQAPAVAPPSLDDSHATLAGAKPLGQAKQGV